MIPRRLSAGAPLWGGAALCLAACRAGGDAPADPVVDATMPPSIVGVTVSCSRKDGAWRAVVDTDAWTGGGAMLWTVDGVYVELQNGFRSVKAAADGTSDSLRLDLRIVDDFRPAGVGGNTAFTCRDEVSALVWVLALDQTPSDCVQLGPRAAGLVDLPDVPACPRVWIPEQAPEDDTPG